MKKSFNSLKLSCFGISLSKVLIPPGKLTNSFIGLRSLGNKTQKLFFKLSKSSCCIIEIIVQTYP